MSQGPAQTCWGALGGLGGTASTYSFASEVRLLNSSTSKPLILLLERSLGKEKKPFSAFVQPRFVTPPLPDLRRASLQTPARIPTGNLVCWRQNIFPGQRKHLSQNHKALAAHITWKQRLGVSGCAPTLQHTWSNYTTPYVVLSVMHSLKDIQV